MTIDRFRGEYAFLSNFYTAPIVVAGITFPTVEHAFQAAKLPLDYPKRRAVQAEIARYPTPAEAKRAGRMRLLRDDWKHVHLSMMRVLLAAKFQHPALRARLLATGNEPLVEGNDWGDTYWGRCRGTGRNMLGVLLMELRAELAPLPDHSIQYALALHDGAPT